MSRAPGVSGGRPGGGSQPPELPRLPLRQHTLDNGLRVVLQPDRRLPLVAINLWYHVGSKNERPRRTGFAHLFEHMLFQGSQHVGTNDHFRYLQQVGGVANGSTWFDRTNYYETVPSHYLDLGLWLESDRLGFLLPAMDQRKLDTQREVVMNERRQRVDNQPYGRAFERLHELLYPTGHPYNWPVIGYMEDIAAATLEDVEAFFRAYYAPNNAVLTLVGDIDCDRALERVETYFGGIPRGADRAPVIAPPLAIDGEVRETLPDAVPLPRLYLAYPAPPIDDLRWFTADLLAAALTGGKSSPLYRELVYRRQIAQDVTATVVSMELGSTLLLVATARPGVEPRLLEEALDEQLRQAIGGDLGEEEVERARRQKLAGYFDGLQAVDDRADLLSLCTTYFGDPGRAFEDFRHYYSVDGDKIHRYCRDELAPGRRVALWVVPEAS